jgi:hypothetical protein
MPHLVGWTTRVVIEHAKQTVEQSVYHRGPPNRLVRVDFGRLSGRRGSDPNGCRAAHPWPLRTSHMQ